MRGTPAAGAPGLRAQTANVIRQRASALSALIEQNPVEALRLALPDDVLSELAAAFPEGLAQLETRGTWEGPIEDIVEDGEDFRTHRRIRTMSVGGETLVIQFADAEPNGLKNGDVLRVNGVRAGTQVAAYGGSVKVAAAKPSPAPQCSTLGPQNSIVLL